MRILPLHQNPQPHKIWLLAAGICFSTAAWAFEFHGYMRSGLGLSKNGTDQACFRAPGTEGASGKHRLGNECDTYIELGFSEQFLQNNSKTLPYFSTNVKIGLSSPGHRDYEPSDVKEGADGKHSQEFTTALREAYAEGHNILIGDATVWMGKRYYRRIDIHMLDYYLVDNTGPGVGFENLDLGFAKTHVAVTRNIPVDAGPAQTNFDLRLSDMSVVGGGSLQPIFIYGAVGERDSQTGVKAYEKLSGMQLALIHNQTMFGGQNMLSLQYGQGLYGADINGGNSALNQYGAWGSQNIPKGDTISRDARMDSSTTRIADQLVAEATSDISAEVVLLYQSVNFGDATVGTDEDETKIPNKNELTFGVRPIYHFTPAWSLALEYGHTQVENGIRSGDKDVEFKDSELNKVTLAPQVSFGSNYWARPTLRFFATYASWNDDSKGQVGGPVYASSTSGFSLGSQFEAWW